MERMGSLTLAYPKEIKYLEAFTAYETSEDSRVSKGF